MLPVRNCRCLIRGIGENHCPCRARRAATAVPVPPHHKRLKSPEQQGHPHGHTANKHCPAYGENGDLFPSRCDKTLPIPLQRVVKQRLSGCCCGDPTDTALSWHWPGSRSASITAGVPGRRRASITSAFPRGPCSSRQQHGSPTICPDQRQGRPRGHATPADKHALKKHSCQAWT